MASSYVKTTEEISGFCCSICLDQFRDPRSLACLHTFCGECIHDFVTKQQTSETIRNGIECPLCRKVTRIKDVNVPPKLWSKIMPVNYALQDIIEALTRDEHTKHTDTDEICHAHNKQIEFFCADENSFCCSTCAISKLKEGKEVNEIKEIASKEMEERGQPLQKKIYDLLLQLNNVKHFLNKKEMDLEIQLNAIDSELKVIQDEIVAKIEHSRALIMSEATCLKEQTIKQYDEQRKNIEQHTSSLEKAKHEFNTAAQHNTPERLFITLRKLEGKVNTLQANISQQLAQFLCFDVKLDIDKMVNEVLDERQLRLGELVTNETVHDVKHLKDCRKIRLRRVAVLDILTSSLEKQPLYSGMDFLPDGRLALVDNANWKLLMLSKQLQVLNRHQFSSHIFDIVAASDNELFVTGAKRLENLLIDSDRGFVQVQTTTLESCPFSISMLSSDRFIIGTYRSSTPVRLLSKFGTETDFGRITFPEKHWKINDSRCAYDSKDHILVLTDRFDHSVYIYDTQIHHETRVKNEIIVEPRGVAFGPFGCIFVCSRGTNSVVQLSRYGEVLGEHVLDMMYPCTICFSKDNKKVAVTNSYADAKQLQIFKISVAE